MLLVRMVGFTSAMRLAKSSATSRKKFLVSTELQASSTTMPSATTTKSAMAGTKRKSAPVKNVYVKENKKAKIDSAGKMASKSKKPAKVPAKEVSSDSDEDDLDSDADGGVPLGDDTSDPESSEEIPSTGDGLHPERAKAVVANSKLHPRAFLYHTLMENQVNPRRKHMPNRSNWPTNEKLQSRWRMRWPVRRRSGNVYDGNPMFHSRSENNW
jgi:pumilio family protein 6